MYAHVSPTLILFPPHPHSHTPTHQLYPKKKSCYYSDSDGSETEGSSSPTSETFTTIFRGVR